MAPWIGDKEINFSKMASGTSKDNLEEYPGAANAVPGQWYLDSSTGERVKFRPGRGEIRLSGDA